ncbi:putative RNA-directed DNA polymerase [Rosa chinensis]|uniref:Putative RNA-directed DNA polymerase n=1 Tax=Rosa chinensis TaxID=74649 RepID=A0A2P6SA77_ROSCH|nr:putative RNA-directed DNA polymerase [Rosa chinensis]
MAVLVVFNIAVAVAPPPIEICERQGHSAIDCYNRMNHAYVGRIPPAKLTALFAAPTTPVEAPVAFAARSSSVLPTPSFSQTVPVHPPYSPTSPGFSFFPAPVANSTWLADSGASQHVTPDLSQLSEAAPYYGNTKLTVGNGQHLRIAHIGSAIMHTPSASFHMNNVLHVPEITQNLLSVNRFVSDNNCAFVLTPSGSMIKDLGLRRTLSQGPVRDGVYPIHFNSSSSLLHSTPSPQSPQVQSASLLSSDVWHARLGHANSQVVNKVLQAIKVPAATSKHSLCVYCMQGKAHRLPFSPSSSICSGPLQLLHADVWGPASISSTLGHRYFLSLVDDWSKFCWIIPLFKKSDVPLAFHIFKLRVENLLSTSIKTLRSDGGGEFTSNSFKLYLTQHGIQHQLSCPHTPQQNGVVERKHRHIIEMARTILAQSQLPYSYWLRACLTATFTINRLPTMTSKSPFEILYNKAPDYQFLKPFGCLCFPWLRPYTTHKFAPRSSPCIFIGYSHDHKGYDCLDPISGRIYTSRHVQFDETSFPFKTHTAHTSSSTHSDLPIFLHPYSPPIPTTSPLSSQSFPSIPTPHTSSPTHHSTSTSPTLIPSPRSNPLPAIPTSVPSPPPIPAPLPPNQPPLPNTSRHILRRSTPAPSPHNMLTRSKTGHSKPKVFFATNHPLPKATALFASCPITPTSYSQASKYPAWTAAMKEEISALQHTNTWTLVPHHPNMNVVGCKWVYRVQQR